MMKRSQLLVGLFLMFSLVGCQQKEEAIENSEQPILEEPAEEIEEVEERTYPFTGQIRTEDQLQVPLVVTLNNEKPARPQSGVQQADLLYEWVIEGGGTRYLAIFQSEWPEKVGPVRSARHYFLPIAADLEAFYIAHGYSPYAKKELDSGVVHHVNGMQYDGTLFKRSKERRAPHNSYLSKESIEQAFEMQKLDEWTTEDSLPKLKEEEQQERFNQQATNFEIRLSGVQSYHSTYTYTPSGYERDVAKEAFIDLETNQRVLFQNILALEAPYQTIDSEGRQDVDLKQGGRALLFKHGTVKELTWTYDKGLFALESDGQPVGFANGKTMVHLIPTQYGLSKGVQIFHQESE